MTDEGDRQAQASEGRPERLSVLGAQLEDLSADDVVARIFSALDARTRARVLNANAYMLNLTYENAWLRDLFREAEITFFDGVGAQLAARILSGRHPRRTTPPEWAFEIARGVAKRGGSIYMLGGEKTAAILASERLNAATGVRVAGVRDGFFDHAKGSTDNVALLAEINGARPDVLFINMGMPRQERWLYDHWNQLDAPIAITAGALVDHLAGRVRRPPKWVADMGLEWLVRLAVEPARLWRRYVLGLPVFGWRVLRERLSLSAQSRDR